MNLVTGIRPYHVLVVDDAPDHAMLVKIVFAHLDANARIQVCGSAEEAIALLEQRPDPAEGAPRRPDVIVLDLNMPGMGGLGFLDWYARRAEFQDIPVVVFTSESQADVARRCFALGAREFKEKPADFAELVPIVQRCLEKWLGSDVANLV